MAKVPEWAQKAIKEAKEKGLKELSLNGLGGKETLTKIPDEVFELTNLTRLDLSYNKLTEVPESITKLTNLTWLDLSYNKLTEVPESITKMTNLNTLYLRADQLTEVPESITKLTNLTWLDLSYNKLTEVPESITKMTNLTWLDLSHNKLTEVPESITKITNLNTLDLSYNKLTEVPESITKLTNLTWLDLSYNKLTEVPESITKLTKLTSLSLSNNQLTEIPESITKLTKLTALDLDGNPIKTPPPEIAKKGIDAIRDYFRQMREEGEEYLYEAKMLIVGEGGAGKTTLAKKIMDPNYKLKENEGTTWGIDVIEWDFPMSDGQNFRVNMWDFGGQQIYHATHQFFLTKRSLYVLVADTRKEDTDFFYWLNVVELLSDNSPVLIIKNEKQDRYREINERQLKGRFDNLKDVLATNLATNKNLDKVIDEIKHQIQRLPHIGNALPKTWAKVREKLEEDNRNYISQDEYLRICQENGFTQMKDKLQLSGYLHDLGVCLHFQDDPVLTNTVILKPEWATDAVYKALDNKDVIRNFGRFSKDDLANIWNEPRYEGKYNELLQMMLKFKLCYEIPGSKGKYIAPQLLTMNQPDYKWEEDENIIIRYTYDFMPKGMISLFIVAMHEYITCDNNGDNCLWKDGVVLEKDKTKAEVIELYDQREIRIRVEGKNKKELLAIVMFEWENIHKSYNRLKYEIWVPCNCEECKDSQDPFFYKYSILRKFREDGKNEIQCQESYLMVDVLGLIDDVIITRKLDNDYRKEPQDEKPVFISYVTKDFDKAKRLYDELSAKGVNVWLDKENLEVGDNWKYEIRKAIQNASFFIACFSEEYYKRDETFENEELVQALERVRKQVNKTWLLPVLLSDCQVPDIDIGAGKTLRDIQSVRLYQNWDDGVRQILGAIMKKSAKAD